MRFGLFMTPSRHKPGRNPAAQQSPAVPRCAIFRSEAREIPASEPARVHHAARRRSGRVASRGARAAGDEGTHHRVLGRDHGFGARPWTAAFEQRLRELGWIEGRNVTIEYRWAEGHGERFAQIAAELVRLKVDIIVTAATAPALAAKQATSTVPIVFALATDPIGSGLVASLARPGGNVTGLSIQNVDLVGKRVRTLARGCS